MPKTKTNLGILAYMETMKDDADKLIETTHAEYIPVAKNCSAHTVAFERVGNKTEEVLASIKSQDAYQNETDALKAEMRIYSDQLSHMKESFQNATEEQNTVGVQHENKTLECFSHMDLHKRMVKMLKKLKKGMAKSVEKKKDEPTMLLEMDTDMVQSLRSMAEEYGMKSLNKLKSQILDASRATALPSAITSAFRILVSDIKKEKDMKAHKCEEQLGDMEMKLKAAKAVTSNLYPKINKWNKFVDKILKPRMKKLKASMHADNERVKSILKLQAHRNRKFAEHKATCNRKKQEYEEEINNAKSMLEAIAMIKKAIENPTMAVKYAVRDVEKSLRKQAANVDESQEYEYMPRLANAIKKYQQAGTFVAPTDDEIDAGSQPNKVDKYGCNNYAGYTWCTFNKKCQRHWEEPCYYHAEVASNLRAKE